MRIIKPTRAITFDCYGTLVDWESGLWKIAGIDLADAGVEVSREQFLKVWEPIQFAMIQGPYRSYRSILHDSFLEAGKRLGAQLTEHQASVFAGSMGTWEPFPDVPEALAKIRGLYILAPISNTDDEFLNASARSMGDPFHHLFTAQQAGAYKPSTKPFELAIAKLGLHPAEILHVAFGYRYDLGPAREMGMRTAWLNRGSEALPPGFSADFELNGMEHLVSLATRAC